MNTKIDKEQINFYHELSKDVDDTINPATFMLLLENISDEMYPILREELYALRHLGITGTAFYRYFNDACGKDLKTFQLSTIYFRKGFFTKEEIFDNLTSEKPVSFYDENVEELQPINDATRKMWIRYSYLSRLDNKNNELQKIRRK